VTNILAQAEAKLGEKKTTMKYNMYRYTLQVYRYIHTGIQVHRQTHLQWDDNRVGMWLFMSTVLTQLNFTQLHHTNVLMY